MKYILLSSMVLFYITKLFASSVEVLNSCDNQYQLKETQEKPSFNQEILNKCLVEAKKNNENMREFLKILSTGIGKFAGYNFIGLTNDYEFSATQIQKVAETVQEAAYQSYYNTEDLNGCRNYKTVHGWLHNGYVKFVERFNDNNPTEIRSEIEVKEYKNQCDLLKNILNFEKIDPNQYERLLDLALTPNNNVFFQVIYEPILKHNKDILMNRFKKSFSDFLEGKIFISDFRTSPNETLFELVLSKELDRPEELKSYWNYLYTYLVKKVQENPSSYCYQYFARLFGYLSKNQNLPYKDLFGIYCDKLFEQLRNQKKNTKYNQYDSNCSNTTLVLALKYVLDYHSVDEDLLNDKFSKLIELDEFYIRTGYLFNKMLETKKIKNEILYNIFKSLPNIKLLLNFYDALHINVKSYIDQNEKSLLNYDKLLEFINIKGEIKLITILKEKIKQNFPYMEHHFNETKGTKETSIHVLEQLYRDIESYIVNIKYYKASNDDIKNNMDHIFKKIKVYISNIKLTDGIAEKIESIFKYFKFDDINISLYKDASDHNVTIKSLTDQFIASSKN